MSPRDFRAFDARGDAGKAKIREANLPGSTEHDICRLQVAVDHPAFVRCGQTRADLARDLGSLVRGMPADSADDRSEVFAIDRLHCQEERSVGFTDVKHASDIQMRDLPGGGYFGMKPGERGGILGEDFGATTWPRFKSPAQYTSPIPPRPASATAR